MKYANNIPVIPSAKDSYEMSKSWGNFGDFNHLCKHFSESLMKAIERGQTTMVFSFDYRTDPTMLDEFVKFIKKLGYTHLPIDKERVGTPGYFLTISWNQNDETN